MFADCRLVYLPRTVERLFAFRDASGGSKVLARRASRLEARAQHLATALLVSRAGHSAREESRLALLCPAE